MAVGVYIRYSPSPIKEISAGPFTYFIPEPFSVKPALSQGLFLAYSKGDRPRDSSHEVEQSLALSYAPGHWASVKNTAGEVFLNNEGHPLAPGVPPERAWPAFGQPGGDFEVIWQAGNKPNLEKATGGKISGGTVFGPYRMDNDASWPWGLGATLVRGLDPAIAELNRPNLDPQPPDYQELDSRRVEPTRFQLKLPEDGGVVLKWIGGIDAKFGRQRRFAASVAHLSDVLPIRLRFWGYTWVDLGPRDSEEVRLLRGPICREWNTGLASLRDLREELTDHDSPRSHHLQRLWLEIAVELDRISTPSHLGHGLAVPLR